MLKTSLKLLSNLFFIFLLTANFSWAVDIIKMAHSQSTSGKRTKYKNEVILRALELTVPEYGPYEYQLLDVAMNRHRGLLAIIKGEQSNIFIAPANDEWDKKTIAIKIPFRLGLLNYRLLLINKVDLPKFAQVNSIDDLKALTAGLKSGWVTTDIFKQEGLKFVETQNFDGLFLLLDNHRFNYVPRAIYEINDELNARQHLLSNVVIEPTLTIHLPIPTYIHVSPTEPRIAKRLEAGLQQMLNNGELNNLLSKYYADDIQRANLKKRKIIKIENPYYNDLNLLNDQTLWYQL